MGDRRVQVLSTGQAASHLRCSFWNKRQKLGALGFAFNLIPMRLPEARGRRALWGAAGTPASAPLSPPHPHPSWSDSGAQEGRELAARQRSLHSAATSSCTKPGPHPQPQGPPKNAWNAAGLDSLLQTRRGWLCAQSARTTDPQLERSFPDL